MSNHYKYRVKKANEMSETEFAECANLFSSSYGKYSDTSGRNPGAQVRMSPAFFKGRYNKEGVFIATCRYYGHLVGQAILLGVRILNGGQ